MSKPDFFIVGAAKCGTTSLTNYLAEHPSIYSPSQKEPKYYSYISGINKLNGPADYKTIQYTVKTEAKYHNLYKNKASSQITFDASVDNIYYYKNVIPLIIKEFGSKVKIVIILRDPVARAFSAFQMQNRDLRETLPYIEALEKEEDRIADKYEFIWHYKNCGLYYNQVKAYKDNFENVEVILQEDLKNQPQKTLNKLCAFLEIDNFEFNLDKEHNVTGIPKNKFLHKLLVLPNPTRFVRHLLPRSLRTWINKKVIKKIIGYQKVSYKGEQKENLVEFFKDDVQKLSTLLGKDLNNLWLKKYE